MYTHGVGLLNCKMSGNVQLGIGRAIYKLTMQRSTIQTVTINSNMNNPKVDDSLNND